MTILSTPLRRLLVVLLATMLAATSAVASSPSGERARVLVAVETGTGLDAAAAAVVEAGGVVTARLESLGVLVADVPDGAAAGIADVDGVTAVEDDTPVELHDGAGVATTAAPADDSAARALGAPAAWRNGVTGAGVGIAVIDTGVTEVPDLAGRVVRGLDLTADQDGVDRYGHGTPIAGLAAGDGASSDGRITGVAPGAHVVPVKIAGADGSTELARLLVAMDWVVRNADAYDIGVVNLSLGTGRGPLDLVRAAAAHAWNEGLFVVVAAGNDGAGSLGAPADDAFVAAVGATLGNDTPTPADDVLAPWSATGLDVDGVAKPDLVAPGQSLVAPGAPRSWAYTQHPEGHVGAGYQRVSGTSFSAGLLSGAAALVRQAHPDWGPDQVLGALVDSAVAIDGSQAPMPRVDLAVAATAPSNPNAGATKASMLPLAQLGAPSMDVLLDVAEQADPRSPTDVDLRGSSWYGSSWYGSSWYGSSWYGSSWYGSSWYGSSWYGSSWYGSSWYGSSWYGAGWS